MLVPRAQVGDFVCSYSACMFIVAIAVLSSFPQGWHVSFARCVIAVLHGGGIRREGRGSQEWLLCDGQGRRVPAGLLQK